MPIVDRIYADLKRRIQEGELAPGFHLEEAELTRDYHASRVTLREEIVAVNGKRLVIDVVAARGEERRHWQEVVTDTKENESRSVVDELWIYEGEVRRRLANEKNKDLERLHEWTLVLPESKPHDVQKTQAQVGFAGAMHACERTSGADALGGRAIRFEANECPHFV